MCNGNLSMEIPPKLFNHLHYCIETHYSTLYYNDRQVKRLKKIMYVSNVI